MMDEQRSERNRHDTDTQKKQISTKRTKAKEKLLNVTIDDIKTNNKHCAKFTHARAR